MLFNTTCATITMDAVGANGTCSVARPLVGMLWLFTTPGFYTTAGQVPVRVWCARFLFQHGRHRAHAGACGFGRRAAKFRADALRFVDESRLVDLGDEGLHSSL
jgi:hypothetical protein